MHLRAFICLVILLMLVPATEETVANCLTHSQSGTLCILCNVGYYVDNSGATCTQRNCSTIGSCSLCDTNTTCVTCNFGYTLSGDRLTCTKTTCNDSNCDLCASTAANQCFSCVATYFVTSTFICDLCTTNITNCQYCTEDVGGLVCTACLTGYYTDSNVSCAVCSAGEANCIGCDSLGAGQIWCWDCNSTHFISNYTAGTCDLCNVGVTNCITCREDNTNANNVTCLACSTGYYADPNGTVCSTCSVLDPNCTLCNEVTTNGNVTGGLCTNCSTPFYVLTNGSCMSCNNSIDMCNACEEDGSGGFLCSSCNPTYWLNVSVCAACPGECSTCDNDTHCTGCANNSYFLNASTNMCEMCSSHNSAFLTCQLNGVVVEALSCATFFYLNGTVCDNCTVQNPLYETCINSSFALSCVTQYYLVSNNCVDCQGINSTWASCDNATMATSCISGYYLSSGECLLCTDVQPYILTCASPTNHTTCNSSYLIIN